MNNFLDLKNGQYKEKQIYNFVILLLDEIFGQHENMIIDCLIENERNQELITNGVEFMEFLFKDPCLSPKKKSVKQTLKYIIEYLNDYYKFLSPIIFNKVIAKDHKNNICINYCYTELYLIDKQLIEKNDKQLIEKIGCIGENLSESSSGSFLNENSFCEISSIKHDIEKNNVKYNTEKRTSRTEKNFDEKKTIANKTSSKIEKDRERSIDTIDRNMEKKNPNKGSIYLLIKKNFIDSGEKIYKIGRTCQFPPQKRVFDYPESSVLLWMIDVDDCYTTETMIKQKLQNNCLIKHRIDLGNEYYEGDVEEIAVVFWIIYRNSVNCILNRLDKNGNKLENDKNFRSSSAIDQNKNNIICMNCNCKNENKSQSNVNFTSSTNNNLSGDSYTHISAFFLKQKIMNEWFESNVINVEHHFGVLSMEKHILTLKESWDNFYKYFSKFHIDDPQPLKKELKKYMENKIGMKVIKSSTNKLKGSNETKNYQNFWYKYKLISPDNSEN